MAVVGGAALLRVLLRSWLMSVLAAVKVPEDEASWLLGDRDKDNLIRAVLMAGF